MVFQNTEATAQGIYLGPTATAGLTVFDTLLDNFGNYARITHERHMAAAHSNHAMLSEQRAHFYRLREQDGVYRVNVSKP